MVYWRYGGCMDEQSKKRKLTEDERDDILISMSENIKDLGHKVDNVDRRLTKVEERLAKVEIEVSKKPDRDEVQRIVEDVVRNHPFYLVVDRDKTLDHTRLEELVRRVVKEELRSAG